MCYRISEPSFLRIFYCALSDQNNRFSPVRHHLIFHHLLLRYEHTPFPVLDITITLTNSKLRYPAVTVGKYGTHMWDISLAHVQTEKFLIVSQDLCFACGAFID